jgi:hypothetical protein
LGADPCPPAPGVAEPALICPIVIAKRGGEEVRKRRRDKKPASNLTGKG